MSRSLIVIALLAIVGVATCQKVPTTFTTTYTQFDSAGVKLEYGQWLHDTNTQRDRYDLVAAVDGSMVTRMYFFDDETMYELNGTSCDTDELNVLYRDPFEWLRVAEDKGNSTADDGTQCEMYEYLDKNGNVKYSGCFVRITDDSKYVAPRVVSDMHAGRVWHFQTFEMLQVVPEEQFIVPDICFPDGKN